jgi:hypothetical protein
MTSERRDFIDTGIVPALIERLLRQPETEVPQELPESADTDIAA